VQMQVNHFYSLWSSLIARLLGFVWKILNKGLQGSILVFSTCQYLFTERNIDKRQYTCTIC
jgi:hypothetical protein